MATATKTKPEVKIDIQPRGIASAVCYAPFDEAKQELEEQGYKIISLQGNAKLRIQEGKDAYVSQNGNRTREGVLYVQNKGIFLTKNSPIMENPEEATNYHRNGKDFYLNDNQVEEALTDAVELSNKPIPTNRFKDNKITDYAFGDIAEQYGRFLKDAGIKEMPVWIADLQDKPFARQLWLCRLGDGSGLNGGNWCLDYGRLRGVCESAKGTAKNLEVYNPKQIIEALKRKGLSGIEKTLLNTLRQ